MSNYKLDWIFRKNAYKTSVESVKLGKSLNLSKKFESGLFFKIFSPILGMVKGGGVPKGF